jgi:hypothetical protein
MSAKHPMMKCGCAANATCSKSAGVIYDPPIPSCVVHSCLEVEDSPPDLSARTARCTYCKSERPSGESERLAFFRHLPNADHDDYYCGCRGWD